MNYAEIFGCLKPNQTLFIPGSSGEPRPFIKALHDEANSLPPLHIVNTFLPGINSAPLADVDNQLTETVFFPRPLLSKLPDRIQLLPMAFYAASHFLREISFDYTVIQVSTPSSEGHCSLGVSVEFTPLVLVKSKGVIAFINKQMPFLPGAPSIPLSSMDIICHVDWPLVNYDPGAADPTSKLIADNLRTLIDDGSTLQVGLGKVPNQLLSQLTGRKNLRFHSGMLSDGFITLHEANALDENYPHTTCMNLGSNDFYRALPSIPNLIIDSVDNTHNPRICEHAGLIAINSALEVDLFGQANLETLGTKIVSGPGGAPDFSRAARYATGGKSIVALPSVSTDGKTSRIVKHLSHHHSISLNRFDIDYVVTEHGIAHLSDKNLADRAQAIADIAHPSFREQLSQP